MSYKNDEARRADNFGKEQRDGQSQNPRKSFDFSSIVENPVQVALTNWGFPFKPRAKEIRHIMHCIKVRGYETVSYREFVKAIENGYTFCCGCYKADPNGKKFGEFVGMQLLALDFDNPTPERTVSIQDVLDRCEENDIEPLCYYNSFSSTRKHPKFHFVFDMGDFITDESECTEYLLALLDKFPESDQSCKNLNRLWFGTKYEVHDCQPNLRG